MIKKNNNNFNKNINTFALIISMYIYNPKV